MIMNRIITVALSMTTILAAGCSTTKPNEDSTATRIDSGKKEILELSRGIADNRVQPVFEEDDSYYLATPKPVKLPERLPVALTEHYRLVEAKAGHDKRDRFLNHRPIRCARQNCSRRHR